MSAFEVKPRVVTGMKFQMKSVIRFRNIAAIALAGAVLGACAATPPEPQSGATVFDPYEKTNRKIHAFNLGVDKLAFRPASKGYVNVVPEPMVTSFSHFADNLSMPGRMVNSLLQGEVKQAGAALARFVINSTVGIAGLADPASDFEVPAVDTDFGETLHAWGFGEGAYVELPFFGPSNQRDAVGLLADIVTNPLTFAPTRPVQNAGPWADVVQQMGNRGRFSDTVDSILYGSEDSYAQSRLVFLQNRRFELASGDDDAYLDLYSDPYDTVGDDPYAE